MKEELAKKIINTFPDMFFQEGRGPDRKGTMISNIACRDGWFDIIWNLCEEIEAMRPTVLQIKEKFGGLRFYASFPKDYSEQGWEVIREAEKQSSETCEECGQPGEFRVRNGWRLTACDKCYDIYCKEHPVEDYP